MKKDENIREWCERRGICRTTFCAWVKRGRAPTVIRVGRMAIITARADAAWERSEARRAKSKVARREAERRSAWAKAAGLRAAKSPNHIWKKRAAAKAAAETNRRV